MPLLLGGVAAFIALFAGLTAGIDPMVILGRATLAFLLGWVCGQVWYVFITFSDISKPGEDSRLALGEGIGPHTNPAATEMIEGN